MVPKQALKKTNFSFVVHEDKVAQFMLYFCCYHCFEAALWKARVQATAHCLAQDDFSFFFAGSKPVSRKLGIRKTNPYIKQA